MDGLARRFAEVNASLVWQARVLSPIAWVVAHDQGKVISLPVAQWVADPGSNARFGITGIVSVRVCASEFVPSNSQKRTIRRNRDLVATACKPWATEEQYALLQRYLHTRHPGGGMASMGRCFPGPFA